MPLDVEIEHDIFRRLNLEEKEGYTGNVYQGLEIGEKKHLTPPENGKREKKNGPAKSRAAQAIDIVRLIITRTT